MFTSKDNVNTYKAEITVCLKYLTLNFMKISSFCSSNITTVGEFWELVLV